MDLSNLLKLLLENQFDFVVIGGFAGTIHGSSLVTKDLDICMELTGEEIQKLRKLLKNYNPIHRMTPQKLPFLTHPESLASIKNLYLSCDLGSLDILSTVSGVGDFPRVKEQAITITLFKYDCKVISVDDLIRAKNFMNREKDQFTVQELEMIKKLKTE